MKRFGLIILLALFLTACGGGGSGGSDSGGGTIAQEGFDSQGVRLLHGAIDLTPLDLRLGQTVLTRSSFALPTGYKALSAGAQTLSFTVPDVPTSVLARRTVMVSDNSRQTILAYGNNETLGIRFSSFEDSVPELGSGESAIRLVHALVGAAQIRLAYGGATVVGTLSFGKASSYKTVSSGGFGFAVRRVVDSKLVTTGSHLLEEGKAYTLLVTGEVDYQVVSPIYLDG